VSYPYLEHDVILQAIINAIPIPVFCKDTDGRYFAANSAFQKVCRFSLDELYGKSVHDLLPPEAASYEAFQDDFALQSFTQVSYRLIVKRDAGAWALLVYKAPFLRPDGVVGGLIGVITKISMLASAV
jgi:PAS domain S-box-containing protein